eukprot:2247592-Pleurochrysis_carterae.AAC.1
MELGCTLFLRIQDVGCMTSGIAAASHKSKPRRRRPGVGALEHSLRFILISPFMIPFKGFSISCISHSNCEQHMSGSPRTRPEASFAVSVSTWIAEAVSTEVCRSVLATRVLASLAEGVAAGCAVDIAPKNDKRYFSFVLPAVRTISFCLEPSLLCPRRRPEVLAPVYRIMILAHAALTIHVSQRNRQGIQDIIRQPHARSGHLGGEIR